MTDSPATIRSLLRSPLVWLAVVILAVQGWVYWQDTPGLSPALASANCYRRFQSGQWIAALTLDRSPQPDVSLPYCGWPPLYMTGLCLLGLTGLPFWAAGLLYNGILSLVTGWVAVRLFRRLHSGWNSGLIFFLTAACPAALLQLRFVYPTAATPLAVLVVLYGAVIVKEGEGDFWKWAALCGLLAGLSTWVACMTIPAVVISYGWHARRTGDPATRRVVRWALSAGLFMAGVLVLFKAASVWAFAQNDVLVFDSADAGAALIGKALPGVKSVIMAWCYAGVRLFWVLLPVAVLLLLIRTRRAGLPGSHPVLMAAFLTPVLFTLLLPGVMAAPANHHHASAWLPVAFLLPLLLVPPHPFSSRASRVTAGFMFLFFGAVFTQGYRALPDGMFESSRSDESAAHFRAPGDYPQGPAEDSFSVSDVSDVVRKVIEQGFYIPTTYDRTILYNPYARRYARWRSEWQSAFSAPLADRKIALAWIADDYSFAWFTGRILFGLNSMAEMENRLKKLHAHALIEQTAFVVPAESDDTAIRAALEEYGLTLEPRPVSESLSVLAVVRK